MQNLTIIPALPVHWPEIWHIFHDILAEGTTYSHTLESMPESRARDYLMGQGVTAFSAMLGAELVGFYAMRCNRAGRGNHIANASFLVKSEHRGQGIGRVLGEHALAEARTEGYKAMQFNFVISTNERAVSRWSSLGFQTVGTIPGGFQHPDGRLVDVFIMHQWL